MTDIAILFGESDATVWAGFRVSCFSCGRILSALSRRNAPREMPSEDAVRTAASALLTDLGCEVGERVRCSYCASPKERPRTRERYIDTDSWEIRVTEGQAPVSRAVWLAWPGDEEGEIDG